MMNEHSNQNRNVFDYSITDYDKKLMAKMYVARKTNAYLYREVLVNKDGVLSTLMDKGLICKNETNELVVVAPDDRTERLTFESIIAVDDEGNFKHLTYSDLAN